MLKTSSFHISAGHRATCGLEAEAEVHFHISFSYLRPTGCQCFDSLCSVPAPPPPGDPLSVSHLRPSCLVTFSGLPSLSAVISLPPPTIVRHSVGLRFLYGALGRHSFFPSHVASGQCFLTAAGG